MKKVLVIAAMLFSATAAQAGDPSIYVSLIVGAEVCKLDRDPVIRKQVDMAKAELATRVLNKEITSAQIDARAKEIKANPLCKQKAELFRILAEQ